jgi:hypothetical protein
MQLNLARTYHLTTPVFITLNARYTRSPRGPILSTKQTNWATVRILLQLTITTQVPLKTPSDIEEYVQQVVHEIQEAAWNSTPPCSRTWAQTCAHPNKQQLIEKLRLRKQWQNTRYPRIKQPSTNGRRISIPL